MSYDVGYTTAGGNIVGKTPKRYVDSISRYQKANTTQVCIRLSKKYDADIISQLDKVNAKATYIKRLIRNDICYDKEGNNNG